MNPATFFTLRIGSTAARLASILLLGLAANLFSCRPPPPDYSGTGYLIITPEALLESVTDLAAFKEDQGFVVQTTRLEDILATQPGDDAPEQVRNFLVGYYPLRPEKEFVLLVGSMASMPMRIAHTNPIQHDDWDVPTDYYYAELTCDWDADGNGFFGEWGYDMTPESCDYGVETWVGRLPWDDPAEVRRMVEAIVAYETDNSERMRRALGAAAIIRETCDAALFVQMARENYLKQSGYRSTALYEMCPVFSPDFELTRANFLGQWEAQEPGFVAWFSHGTSYSSLVGNHPYEFISVDALPQGVRPSLAITSGCTVANPEVESLGRVLLREGVVASFLGSSRTTMPGANPLPAFLAQYKMGENVVLRRQALGEATANAIDYYVANETPGANVSGEDFNRNIFEFMILGDPAIQVR